MTGPIRSRLATFWGSIPLPAKIVQAAAIAFFFWGATCGVTTSLPGPITEDTGDLALYRAIVARVDGGEGYYAVTGDELHARGYATVPAFNWRLPTLAVLLASLPSERHAGPVILVLGVLTAVLWCFFLARSGHGILCVVALPLLLSMAPAWGGSTVNFHEVWAGQLLALSLATRAFGLVSVSVITGALALSIRELALPYVVIMCALALDEGDRREAAAWAIVTAIFGGLLASHLSYAASLTRPDAFINGWVAGGGWCHVLKTTRTNLAFSYLPLPLLAAVVAALWAGLWVWSDRGITRVAWVVSAYLVIFAVVGRADNFYWGLMVAPLLPLGLIGWAVALGRRRQI